MNTIEKKKYWDSIFKGKPTNQRSWYQKVPSVSLEFIAELKLPLMSKILDNGAGDSFFIDSMLDLGYTDITVSDISAEALDIVKKRLGEKASKVKWVVADEANCDPSQKFDLWHDRAAFHFLTDENEINNYVNTVKKCIKPGGYFIIGTFSENGPKTCSGLNVKQYSETDIAERFNKYFNIIKCKSFNHYTPSNIVQNFTYCSLRRK